MRLTDLPTPFISLRHGLQGERVWIDNFLPGIRERQADPTLPPLAVETMRAMVERLGTAYGMVQGDGRQSGFGLLMAAAKYPIAKVYLAEKGWTTVQIDAMPVLQAVCLYELAEYDRFFDEAVRSNSLPLSQAYPAARASEARLQADSRSGLAGGSFFARQFVPSVSQMIVARGRVDRQIVALRTLEAIRLHAAGHAGALPVTLDEITAVPLPLDPGTGTPMAYTRTGDIATLKAPRLPGETTSHTIEYRIKIALIPQ